MIAKPKKLVKARAKPRVPINGTPTAPPLAPFPLSPPSPLEEGVAGVLVLLPPPPPEVVGEGEAFIPPSPYGHPTNSSFGEMKQVNPAAVPLMN